LIAIQSNQAAIVDVLNDEMAFSIKKPLIPVFIIGIGALVSHFLPNFVKPKKEGLELIPETQAWKK